MTAEFSVGEIPFSRAGAWFGLSPVLSATRRADDVHVVSHRHGLHPVLALVPERDGHRAATDVSADPAVLTWRSSGGRITAAFPDAGSLRIAGTGLGMSIIAAEPALTPFTGPYFFADPSGAAVFTFYETGNRLRLTLLSGHWTHVGEQELGTARRGVTVGADGGPWEVALEEISTGATPYVSTEDFPRAAAAARGDFTGFADAVAPWRDHSTPAAELACYVLWSATVAPAGFLARPAVLMSKHWMNKVWSWDHCFTALALAPGAPELAWNQYQLPFDHQDGLGALPDSVTHAEVLRNFVKPPIHGWALAHLRGRLPGGLPDPELAYRQLAAWTSFWLDHRRAPGQRLPYYEHGNDSGWDNATVFAGERLVVTADLAAFLVLQLKELAALARVVGDTTTDWARRADTLLAALLAELWDGSFFGSRTVRTGTSQRGSSLLDLMPIVLGEHLPRDVFERLCVRVAEHLTPVGLATELPSSPHYEPDGYWRGPVWAPVTVLVEDGLRRGGATDLADEVSSRFRRTCEQHGFAENFDALTGAGLRDHAYTWTAGAYLLLSEAAQHRRGAREAAHRPAASPPKRS
ncbi:glycogen debranching protein [Amycolatopsis sp. FBCC-B4732]|uniref:amylo-alpha-1,6-glucosidase n=1 Tax=Amycolatopsis sp. FBCC-B4732 TaxID=3079339 RepID=UPI001FF1D4C4|nr:trehalase family glycosidase [Amycolatopsis sp. FBCC-B4732]UOX90722.1 glycogen debranching protein [Amycolatopsis sp. FBCC-B4732]